MADIVSTDNLDVAQTLAAMELTKTAKVPETPESIANAYKAIFRAIREAQGGR